MCVCDPTVLAPLKQDAPSTEGGLHLLLQAGFFGRSFICSDTMMSRGVLYATEFFGYETFSLKNRVQDRREGFV